MNDIDLQLKTIIARISGQSVIERRHRILHDLDVGGDDAWELLEDIHRRFGAAFAEMPFADFFPNETEAMASHWWRKLGFRSSKRELTVGHLVDVVGNGAWFEPQR